MILKPNDSIELFTRFGGGKARNMSLLSQKGVRVPEWFCVSAEAFLEFVKTNKLDSFIESLAGEAGDRSPKGLQTFAAEVERRFLAGQIAPHLASQIEAELKAQGLDSGFVAVRSSGLDEDSADNSFAGQFSSYLFQRGQEQILESLKKCWASGFSERALAYRLERGISLAGIAVGVVIQKMVNADAAGVAFSRNPIRCLDRESILVSSVWGLGEGLVSGALEADSFDVNRTKMEFKSELVEKTSAFRQAPEGGLRDEKTAPDDVKRPSLSDAQVREVAQLTIQLEEKMGRPQDCEWAYEKGQLYCVQTRPITNIPPDAFFQDQVRGLDAILWDNSNIVESYSGVTSPLTFSFASRAYRQVYIQFCEVMGVPEELIEEREPMFRNMLGLIRGRIYYNLINWYKLVLMLPGSSNNKGFMETMMGVKQGLKPEVAQLFDFMKTPYKYSFGSKIVLTIRTIQRFLNINTIIGDFNASFVPMYESSRKKDFAALSLSQQVAEYEHLENHFLKRWQAPIINDYLCMVFFGLIKKLTEKWVAAGDTGASLQNDLLCGQGDLESTEPTKTLMRIAAKIDKDGGSDREFFLSSSPQEVWAAMSQRGKLPVYTKLIYEFLDRYGFRCINELKLEENDLHDDPAFAVNSIQSYVRTKSYSIDKMEVREREIRAKAEEEIKRRLGGVKLMAYQWVMNQTRKAVRNRENLRFARTKVFGIARYLFRGIGVNLHRLGLLEHPRDVFYLTVEEIIAFNEGRTISLDLKGLTQTRKIEFAGYDKGLPPPDRFLTMGAAGASTPYAQVLVEQDLMRSEKPKSDDPNVLIGTPCCPGVVEGVVRVVKDVKDAEGLNGEILVTERTDPGWVPLYPSCSGLLIERGSLLSHSAVVARELGLPTIVGISGGLMKKLKTGMRVRLDGARGEVRILPESELESEPESEADSEPGEEVQKEA
jgi:phosphohistidine swiveling domain-containing protein